MKTARAFLAVISLLAGLLRSASGAQLIPPRHKPEHKEPLKLFNPITAGWFAEPDIVKFRDTYWIYATVSEGYIKNPSFAAFSSKDLVTWTRQSDVFTRQGASWAKAAYWAPRVVERNNTYYMYYTANDPFSKQYRYSGIGVAVSATPGGPFMDIAHWPIASNLESVPESIAVDPQVFMDDDGNQYLLYGCKRINIARLDSNMVGLGMWRDGTRIKNLTPEEPEEEIYEIRAPYMFKRNGWYYLTWAEESQWSTKYHIGYAMSKKLLGPYKQRGIITWPNRFWESAAHHSVVKDDEGQYYLAYSRRYSRQGTMYYKRTIAVDRLYFRKDGSIQQVKMT